MSLNSLFMTWKSSVSLTMASLVWISDWVETQTEIRMRMIIYSIPMNWQMYSLRRRLGPLCRNSTCFDWVFRVNHRQNFTGKVKFTCKPKSLTGKNLFQPDEREQPKQEHNVLETRGLNYKRVVAGACSHGRSLFVTGKLLRLCRDTHVRPTHPLWTNTTCYVSDS